MPQLGSNYVVAYIGLSQKDDPSVHLGPPELQKEPVFTLERVDALQANPILPVRPIRWSYEATLCETLFTSELTFTN